MQVRPLMRYKVLCLAASALATGCAEEAVKPVARAEFRSPLEAFLKVCEAPSSHSSIEATVRSLGWPRLIQDQLPTQVTGNGMVTWAEVAQAPDQSMIIAAGRLNDTSFCRVYSRRVPLAPLQYELERTTVVGQPLGQPDFRQRLEDRDVIGWHKGAENWRTVHVSADPSTAAEHPSTFPVVIEMTRLAS